ncbi:crossover junction endodeoxyribonuclease RuvC [Desulfothermobacter acidiphilus]|uniref:crossover junction endodeoxyribonuclease RuvC n=1 Tax=Desulfothermobacter acidiphilus TaxID=1938353 RepID=UPI003F8A7724
MLGIDPGAERLGYGLVREKGSSLQAVTYGCFTTPRDQPLSLRLLSLYRSLLALLQEHSPAALAVEELFWGRNVRTAMMVGQSRGVVLLAAAESGCPVFSYPPQVVKQAVTGQGCAAKRQVQYMVQKLLSLPVPPSPDDSADALALAICHLTRAVRGWC